MSLRLSIADLDLAVQDLRSAFCVPPEKRGVAWAGGRCVDTRFVHKNVWKFRPNKKDVESQIIPLLRDTKEAVIAMCLGDYNEDERKRLVVYARNIGLRLANLEENYLRDKPSDFAPDDRLDNEEKRIWEHIASARTQRERD